MLILISPAKTFASVKSGVVASSEGLLFPEQTVEISSAILKLSSDYLVKELKLKPDAAQKAYQQWRKFVDPATPSLPALSLYSGMVFKKIGVATLGKEARSWLNEHLLICSFAYGLLRSIDPIRPYRLEGTLDPQWSHGHSIFHYWRDVLTDYLIREIGRHGGVLCFLASEEMKQLFHWEQVEQAVRVVTPRFLVQDISGKTKQIVIYTKMARGSMVRSIAERQVEDPEMLKTLTPEGYMFSPEYTEGDNWGYLLQG
ncbi:MAG: YaaA family protein [Porphyromonadaceae bacterium]|nr:YaaA family protein [Porphyromonadaceae bacterium]